MQKITPFLWFDTNAEEAMQYYVSVFNGNPAKSSEARIIKIQRYPDGPLEGPMKGFEGKVLTGVFELEGQRFMALDGGPIFKFTESTSFLVECKNQAEIDYYWERLSAVPASEQCGWCKDKFGLSWQIVPDMNKFMDEKDPARFGRAMRAVLQMKKIDIAAIEKAANQK
jgi:predicted 3-demethylubiquinone-9 3-methyltransferase (glyoxalase superfamily)